MKEALNITEDKTFQDIAIPINDQKFPPIRDAEFFVRKDGVIVNAEGWYHPADFLIGEVLYVPDEEGDRAIFGAKYRKVTLKRNSHEPIPYKDRGAILKDYDPALSQEGNPFFAKYKQFFPRSDFIAHLPSEGVLRKILEGVASPSDNIFRDIENMSSLLGISIGNMKLGITGAGLLGNFKGSHDLDLVFKDGIAKNLDLAKRMRELVKSEPERRVIEGGKGWNIRFYNDYGVLMCSFFGYTAPEEAPLIDFEMAVVKESVQVKGVVEDDINTLYTPTILLLRDAIMEDSFGITTDKLSLPLIIYHTATRGECFSGDKVSASGALVKVTSRNDEYMAVCVVEREGVRNLNPSWEGFYLR